MKKFLLILVIIVAGGLFSGCTIPEDSSVQGTENRQVEQNQERLMKAVALPKLDSSLERINIKKRLELFDNEDKISYIYLVSYGKVMSFHTVKGKVTSGGKRLTTNEKGVNFDDDYNGNAHVVEAPSLDGAYGSSAPYIFFWDTNGNYIQWSGEYMLSDAPLKLTTAPALVRTIK